MLHVLPISAVVQLIWSELLYVPVIAAALIGGLRFNRLPPNLRYLAGLAWFELPIELACEILRVLDRNNLFLMPIYTVGELGLLALVYRQTLQSATFSKAVPWLVGAFTTYALLDSLLGSGLASFRPGQQVVQSVLILGMVGLYFRKLLNELSVQHLTREPMFWVSTGLFIYFLVYLQIALFSDFLLRHYSLQLNRSVWMVQYLFAIVLHSCYCLALWMRPPK